LQNRARMRRALALVTLLSVPASALAQAVGSVTFQNNRVNPNTINAGECAVGSNATVLVRWTPQFINNAVGAPVSGGSYIVYGTNTAPGSTTTTTTTAGQCPVQNTSSGNNILVGIVVDTTNSSAPLSTSATISLPLLLQGAGFSQASGCPPDGTTVYICVQGVLNDINSSTNNFAIASAAVTVRTVFPSVPVITRVTPGDGALNVYWDAATLDTAAQTVNIELMATPIGTTTSSVDTLGPRTRGKFSASPARFEGLVNTVIYYMQAQAFTDADNASTFSPAFINTGMPEHVFDFWDIYKNDGGRETGGCGAGAAGPVGLGILLATLALIRRRK